MLVDQPVLAYQNLLVNASYQMGNGVDEVSAPISNAWTWDVSRPALPVADSSGNLVFDVTVAAADGFGKNAFGFTPFGNLGFGGREMASILVLGASRHEAAGHRFDAGQVRIEADGVVVFDEDIYIPVNSSALFHLAPHAAASVYRIAISGLAPSISVRLPEIFIGPSLVMPYVEFGFDEYGEVFSGTSFKAESGREYKTIRFRRVEQRPVWRNLPSPLAFGIRHFIEIALESAQPFWFCWQSSHATTSVYLVRERGKTVKMPLKVAGRFDLSLDLVEAV